ncbi:MAG: hypothetical protein U1D67_02795, partial [Dehalococcoidia bacterium]|nr:hypothetical protein [Dehalococcoidia bacterium]
MNIAKRIVFFLIVVLSLTGCEPESTPTPEPLIIMATPIITIPPVPPQVILPTVTFTPEPTPSPTPKPFPSPTPLPTATPAPSPTPTPAITPVVQPTPQRTLPPVVPGSVQLVLYPGRNLVSLPIIPVDPRAVAVFQHYDISEVSIPYDWDREARKDVWLKKEKGWLDGSYPIQVGEAYWVTLDRPAQSNPVVINLVGIKAYYPFSRWMITPSGRRWGVGVGVPGLEPVRWADTGKFNLAVSYVESYNAVSQRWEQYTGSDLDNLVLEPG